MTTATPRIGLQFMATAQAKKELVFNTAVATLDMLVQTVVKDKDLSTPPGAPVNGDAYLVASGGTAAWTGRSGQIAFWLNGWQFIQPLNGWTIYVDDESTYYRRSAGNWIAVSLTGVTQFQDLTDVTWPGDPSGFDGYVVSYDHDTGKLVLSAPPDLDAIGLGDLADVTGSATPGRMLVVNGTGDGYIFVAQPSIPSNIQDLANVTVSGVANGHILRWISANNRWENRPFTLEGVTLGNIAGVTLTTPADGDFLAFDGSVWRNRKINLTELTGFPAIGDGSPGQALVINLAGDGFEWGDAGGGGGSATLNIISTSTTNYKPLEANGANQYIRKTTGAANTILVPANSDQAFAIGTVIEVEQASGFPVEIVADGGVTVNSRDGRVESAGQFAVLALVKTATDTWTLTGDLA